MADSPKVGDRIKLLKVEARPFGRQGGPSVYPVGSPGTVTELKDQSGSKIRFDGFPFDEPKYTYNTKFEITTPALAELVAGLIGPKPEAVQDPTFVTPFKAEHGYVYDGRGSRIFLVSGGYSTVEQDRELAEEIVRLLNREHGPAEAAASARQTILKLVDAAGADDWFELEPGLWTMGGDSTHPRTRTTEAESLAKAKARGRNDSLARKSQSWISEEFGLQSTTPTRVLVTN